jgi:asparagine synthase (glutamine-hydrolysing)
MSGIVGVLRTDAAPVERGLIQRLTESLTLAGPDAIATWCNRRVAFGHTLLRTTYESEREHQPFSLDGQTWIVADARLDARRGLVSELNDDAEGGLTRASDVELVLRAYRRWGEGCVEHLLGDFAFAIWDSGRQQLFCARDHMGVKPLYYARMGCWLLFSNALECLRRHPAVSDKLHDLAIADFLLFGVNQDPATTSFCDIHRLPPAHTLIWSETGIRVRRYWTLPIEEPIYYRKDREYTDQLWALLREAVSDRLRTDRVSVFMSGGLDSPALAATARHLLDHEATANRVRAFTFVYDSLIPDSERHYAGVASGYLGIPISYYAVDGQSEWAPSASMGTHEPDECVTDRSAELRCYSEMAVHSRVAFYGEGPDNALLYEWRPYLAHLMRRRTWGRLVADVRKHLIGHKRVPLLPTIPRMVQARWALKQNDPPIPAWMAPELVSRLGLRQRSKDLHANAHSPHPVRPGAYASLLSPTWQSMFEAFQPSCTGSPFEVRHPYVDIRLLRFLLRVPALPWCRDKHLMRCALRGVIPEAVRRRSKTPLNGEPDSARIRRHGLPPLTPSRLLEAYGHASRLSNTRLESIAAVGAALRFVALSYWLQGMTQGSKS